MTREEEDVYLVEAWEQGVAVSRIAQKLFITPPAVSLRAKRLGLKRRPTGRPKWFTDSTPEEVEKFKQMWIAGDSTRVIGEAFQLSKSGVSRRAKVLGLPGRTIKGHRK